MATDKFGLIAFFERCEVGDNYFAEMDTKHVSPYTMKWNQQHPEKQLKLSSKRVAYIEVQNLEGQQFKMLARVTVVEIWDKSEEIAK